MKKLVENKIKYIGNGVLEVTKSNGLVEKYKLEKGDNLLESVKKLNEEFSPKADTDAKGHWFLSEDGTKDTAIALYYNGSSYTLRAEDYTDGKAYWRAEFTNEDEARECGESLQRIYNEALSEKFAKGCCESHNCISFEVL